MSDTEIITEEPSRGGRRISPILIALLALTAIVAIYFVGVRPLLASDANDDAVATAAATDPAPADPAPAELVEDVVADVPLVTYEVFLDRDPFDPVVPEPVAVVEPVATDGTATDGTATDGTGTDGTATDGTATDGTATDGTATDGTATDGTATDGAGGSDQPAGCRGGDTVTCDGRIVSLVKVQGSGSDAVAVVQVDSTLYEVGVGETFAGSFQLRSISGSCVTVLYGDDAFELCEGDRVLK